MAKLPAVPLKAVLSVVPRGAKENAMLEEDLRRMDCHGLIKRPWCFKYDKIVAELLADQDNWWVGMVRQDPNKWMAGAWHKVYDFPIRGEGMVAQIDKLVDDKFKNPPTPKDKYTLVDCKDVRARRVLEFLVPLLYSEKPTRVTMTIGNTIFGALIGEREADWALVIRDMMKRLITTLGKSKTSPLYPYVFHLYFVHDAI